MRGRIAGAVLAVLVGLQGFAPSVAEAQNRSNTNKLFLGFSLGGTSIELEGEDDDGNFETEREQGGGGSFRIGYGFTSLFSLYLEGAAAAIDVEGDEFALLHGDLGARFHFGGPARAFIPFLDVAFTGRTIAVDDFEFDDGTGPQTVDVEISGSGFSFGGGFLWFFNPKWALDVGLKATVGEFDTIKVDNITVTDIFEIDATSARLKIGITWFPMSVR